MSTRMTIKKQVMSGRKPDYKLKVKDEKTERWMEVGAAWKNNNGSISVRLNACVVLSERSGVEPVLFPAEWERGDDSREKEERKSSDPGVDSVS